MADDIRVVIPTAGGSEMLQRTLASLAGCTLPTNYRGTIIIENGKPSGAKEIAAAAPDSLQASYLYVAEPGKNRALNACLRDLPDACLVVFSDDDVRYAPDWLVAYSDAASQHTTGHYYGGPTGVDCDQPPPVWLREYLPPSAIGWDPDEHDKSLKEGTFLGFNWAAYAGDIRHAGMFDPALGPGTATGTGDEPDMQRRLRHCSVAPSYVRDAMVWHSVPSAKCSPKFALDRWFRSSVLHGRERPTEDARTLLGVPRYKLRRFAAQWLRCKVTQLLCRDPQKRFDARFRLTRSWGLIKGIRQRSREQQRAESDQSATPNARLHESNDPVAGGLKGT